MFRQPVKLCSYEPAVVASLLKLFLRELPEPVLTTRLGARFVIIIVIVYCLSIIITGGRRWLRPGCPGTGGTAW